MGTARVYRGKASQGNTPEWLPLLNVLGERLTGDFMWMFEVRLTNGTPLQAYKHIDTRRYVHLAPNGDAFAYGPPDLYRPVPLKAVLAEVFAPLAGLAGVTARQISDPWAAVSRLVCDSNR